MKREQFKIIDKAVDLAIISEKGRYLIDKDYNIILYKKDKSLIKLFDCKKYFNEKIGFVPNKATCFPFIKKEGNYLSVYAYRKMIKRSTTIVANLKTIFPVSIGDKHFFLAKNFNKRIKHIIIANDNRVIYDFNIKNYHKIKINLSCLKEIEIYKNIMLDIKKLIKKLKKNKGSSLGDKYIYIYILRPLNYNNPEYASERAELGYYGVEQPPKTYKYINKFDEFNELKKSFGISEN